MNQSPITRVLYKGYVPRGAGQPILIFNTGLLVQEDQDPAKCGWHAFQHRFQIGANMPDDFCVSLNAIDAMPSLIDQAYGTVRDACLEEACLAMQGGMFAPAAYPERYVLFDTQAVGQCGDGPFYQFPGPIVRFTDAHCLPNLGESQALQILGPCDESGNPTRSRAVPVQPGRRRFV